MTELDDYDEWEADDAKRLRECAERGLVIVRPEPDELQVDIDSAQQLALFHAHAKRLGDLVASFKVTPSPSKRPDRHHVTVKLSRAVRDARERVLLQAVLGSDPMRELLSYLRLEAGVGDATIFFELGGET